MLDFIKFSSKAQWIVSAILINSFTHIYTTKGNLPDIKTIVDFLQNVLSPYVSHIQDPEPLIYRASKPSIMEKIINDKVLELHQYLQDYDEESTENVYSDNKDIILNGEETTIIEFLPARKSKKNLRRYVETPYDPLKSDIDKFKKMAHKIKHALRKESVSEKTQSMVTKIFDIMLAQLINNQCNWKKDFNRTVARSHTVDKSALIANKWNEQWALLRSQYLNTIGQNSNKRQFPGVKIFRFFEQFHEFLIHIFKDMEQLSNRYKVVCQFVERKDKTIRERTSNSLSKTNCQYFKVCSAELRSFLTEFYASLNSTSVSTLRNYAAMFDKDVNSCDSHEKLNSVTIVNEISNLAENKVASIFRKEISKLQLDPNKNKISNIKALKRYIAKTIDSANTYIQENLNNELRPLAAKLRVLIRQDLIVNLNLDLGNLKSDLSDILCVKFGSCNGKYDIRRSENGVPGDYNKNSVYVKVQMNLDDEMKEKFKARLGKMPKYFRSNTLKTSNKPGNYGSTMGLNEPDLYAEKENVLISVTRTTHDISTKATETSPSINNTVIILSTNDSTISTPTANVTIDSMGQNNETQKL